MGEKIKKLSTALASKISAGEVVINPASVLKELIENSIDARATNIEVVIKNGGIDYLCVLDDGIGINKDDIKNAFLKNATSKIKSEEDLQDINTMGFRGEALFSISLVSKVVITTKSKDDLVATKAEVIENEVISLSNTSFNTGTKIEVLDLFYNTAARKKHLLSKNKETIKSIDIVSKLALANPNISFKLISNNKEVFNVKGSSNKDLRVLAILGRNFLDKMIKIDFSDQPLFLSGYILSPSFLDKQNEENILIINGRYAKCDAITAVIKEVYKNEYGNFYKSIGYLLYINLPNNMIDPNIHPSKSKVLIQNETLISMLISEAIKKTLAGSNKIQKKIFNKPERKEKTQFLFEEAREYVKTSEKIYIPNDDLLKKDLNEIEIGSIESLNTKEKTHSEILIKEEKSSLDITIFNKLKNLKYIGLLFNAYALFEMGEDAYVIDTHAAHERVLYDKYLKSLNNSNLKTQQLLTPIIITLPVVLKESLKENLSEFKTLGFDLDYLGDEIVIREIPYLFDLKDIKEIILDMLYKIKENKYNLKLSNRNEELIKVACHNAVRGKDKLSYNEVIALIDDLKETNMPFSCPHSRPTISKIEKRYFERMFKRV